MRFFDSHGRPLARSGVAEVLATGEPARDVEIIVERADGSRVTVALNIDPLRDAKGEIVGAINCTPRTSSRTGWPSKSRWRASSNFTRSRSASCAKTASRTDEELTAAQHHALGDGIGRQTPR